MSQVQCYLMFPQYCHTSRFPMFLVTPSDMPFVLLVVHMKDENKLLLNS